MLLNLVDGDGHLFFFISFVLSHKRKDNARAFFFCISYSYMEVSIQIFLRNRKNVLIIFCL